MGAKFKDYTGETFGRLTAINYYGTNKHKRALWLWRCSCGKEVVAPGVEVKRGKTRSCGCLRRDCRIKPYGISSRNDLIASYKMGAKKRSLEYTLTNEEFENLTKQNCYYCGNPPLRERKNGEYANGSYIYNGIDRVDNSKGYTLDNCVSCCFECNMRKKSVTISIARKMLEFIDGLASTS